ncbi:MAG: 2-C-methyl-D-erythritol 4-phosphate cytidylyltransferase [Acidobacteriota bacterium]|nr:MAG: 2-C-methyl-D-erythritol 4-phosphate cytidylyltransferase [Acidobacteriota bacterium]
MNSAIIVAAGEGKRFGGGRPKQFAEILGKPVLVHTIERFEKCDAIDEIVLVLAEGELRAFSDILADFYPKKVSSIVAGGATRAESVLNGLSAVRGEEASIVAIHDGARPVVSQKDITTVLAAAKEHGAACLVAPVTDTIKNVTEGLIKGTVDRRALRRALTPQCFRYEVICEAFESLGPGSDVTDDSSLAESAGFAVSAVEGDPSNIKITYEQDLKVAEIYLAALLESE